MSALRSHRKWVMWALGLYAVAAMILLLSPIGPRAVLGRFTSWVRDDLGWSVFRQGWVEAPANVVLFIPLGFLLTLLFRKAWIGVVSAIVLSVSAELVQTILPDRVASMRDVIANGMGAAIGAGIAWVFVIRRHRSARRRETMHG